MYPLSSLPSRHQHLADPSLVQGNVGGRGSTPCLHQVSSGREICVGSIQLYLSVAP